MSKPIGFLEYNKIKNWLALGNSMGRTAKLSTRSVSVIRYISLSSSYSDFQNRVHTTNLIYSVPKEDRDLVREEKEKQLPLEDAKSHPEHLGRVPKTATEADLLHREHIDLPSSEDVVDLTIAVKNLSSALWHLDNILKEHWHVSGSYGQRR